jgi:dienelactone hydrolase
VALRISPHAVTPMKPFRPPAEPRHRRRLLLRVGLGAAALALGGTGAGLRAARPDDAAEPIELDWHDVRRDRPVPARLYLPAAIDAGPPVPLVLFSHGIGGSRHGYRYLGEHFAAQGFASLHVQHVGSDRSLWTAGSPLAVVARLQAAAQADEAIARVHDLRFALDEVLAGPWGRRLDAKRVAAAGHSYGANTALLAAGARVARDGRVLELREPRLRAVVLLSAPPFYGEPALAPILGGVAIPSLHVTTTEDIIRIPGYYSAVADRVAVYEAIGGPRKLLAVFEGGSHAIFTDRAAPGGPWLNARIKTATRELAAAFLHGTLGGDDSALREWPQRHAEHLARLEAIGLPGIVPIPG